MTSPKHNRSKQKRTLLKVYRMYLMNLPDEEILKAGVTEVELQKCKQFHQDLQGGKYFYMAGRTIGIGDNISKSMLHMFEKKQAGMPLSCNSRTEYPRIMFCFSLILDGASDNELYEKFTPSVIEKAKEFVKYADANMLSSTISRETGILRSTVKNLLKIYREKQAADKLPSDEQHIECIAVATR